MNPSSTMFEIAIKTSEKVFFTELKRCPAFRPTSRCRSGKPPRALDKKLRGARRISTPWRSTALAFTGAARMIRSLICHADADSDVFIRPTTVAGSVEAANLTLQAPCGSANLTIADGATGNYTIGISTGNVALIAGSLLVDHDGAGTLTLGEASAYTRVFYFDSCKLKINNALTLGTATAGALVNNGGRTEKHRKSLPILISKSVHSPYE
jgi:hypothetical protein